MSEALGPRRPRISLSRWVDYLAADNAAKVSKVAEIKRQYDDPYSQGGDYWRAWRSGVVNLHLLGLDSDALSEIVEAALPTRRPNYRKACDGYRCFWGRKTLVASQAPAGMDWAWNDELTVRINPDITLRLRGEDVAVQFHLKADLALTQRLANPALRMLTDLYGPDQPVGILDVHRGKLFRPTRRRRTDAIVLRAQASSFVESWSALDEPISAE